MILRNTIFVFASALWLISCSNVGEEFPDFELTTLEGKVITPSELQGKVTVIDVWATWCHNCASERESLNRLVSSYSGDTSVVFLAMSDEQPAKINAFLKERPFNFVHIANAESFTSKLKTRLVKTYPQHIILDQNLSIQYEHSGELSDPEGTLTSQIDALSKIK